MMFWGKTVGGYRKSSEFGLREQSNVHRKGARMKAAIKTAIVYFPITLIFFLTSPPSSCNALPLNGEQTPIVFLSTD